MFRFLVPVILLSLPAFAQSSGQTAAMLEKGLKKAIAPFEPVPDAEKRVVLGICARLLERSVTFRPDGTASTVDRTAGGNVHMEWRQLGVRTITRESISAADRANGITRRYHVGLSCEASRRWDAKTNTWGAWRDGGSVFFPSTIVVEEIDGEIKARAPRIENFVPGPGNPGKPTSSSGIYRVKKGGKLEAVR